MPIFNLSILSSKFTFFFFFFACFVKMIVGPFNIFPLPAGTIVNFGHQIINRGHQREIATGKGFCFPGLVCLLPVAPWASPVSAWDCGHQPSADRGFLQQPSGGHCSRIPPMRYFFVNKQLSLPCQRTDFQQVPQPGTTMTSLPSVSHTGTSLARSGSQPQWWRQQSFFGHSYLDAIFLLFVFLNMKHFTNLRFILAQGPS